MDTSGRGGSLAVGAGDTVLAEADFCEVLRHSAELFTTAQRLLAEANYPPAAVSHVYLTAGPGSFAGLRIAVTAAKMFALASGAAIVPVGTMDVLAAGAADWIAAAGAACERLGVILDAKRGEFFTAVFARNGNDSRWTRCCDDRLMTAERFVAEFANPDEPIHVLGEGLVYYADRFAAPGIGIVPEKYWRPRARHVYMLARVKARQNLFADAADLVPRYLRGPDAMEKRHRRT